MIRPRLERCGRQQLTVQTLSLGLIGFIQDLAPWYLFDPAAVLEIRTTEKLKDARQEVEVMLGK